GLWPAARRWVRRAVGRLPDDRPVPPGWRVLSGAPVPQERAVLGAGEGDGQEPGLLPRPAILLLDRTAVAGQAGRAVAEAGAEQPVVGDRWPCRAGPAAADRRVAVGPGDERQGGGLAGGQPWDPGEGVEVEGEQGRVTDQRGGPGGASGQAGEMERRDPQAVGQAQQEAVQGLAGDRVQAARKRPQVRADDLVIPWL